MAIKSGAMGQSNMREIKKRIISGNRARFLQLAAFLKKTSKKCNSKWSYNYGGVSDNHKLYRSAEKAIIAFTGKVGSYHEKFGRGEILIDLKYCYEFHNPGGFRRTGGYLSNYTYIPCNRDFFIPFS